MEAAPPYWCGVCGLDLQSAPSLEEHRRGRKHRHRAGSSSPGGPPHLPGLEREEFPDNLVRGVYRHIVVLTGAGVSTPAGIPDYRSSGTGLLERLSRTVPGVSPEALLSRGFADEHPETWREKVLPLVQAPLGGAGKNPTLAHQLCASLARRGILRRVYTQNVDGLHTHPSLGIPDRLVVECHGSLEQGTLVLYGDPLPKRFAEAVDEDFGAQSAVDLLLVLGTSLRVAPFNALPNLAPKHCHRVLVDRNPDGCVREPHEATTCRIGRHKSVSTRCRWKDRGWVRKKRWRQLLLAEDCDEFVRDYAQLAGGGFVFRDHYPPLKGSGSRQPS